MSHLCHAHGCETRVPPAMFMCKPHWFRLRKAMRDAIWREYRPGQEQDKSPSWRYMAVQRRAIGEVAFKPNDEDAARAAAPYLLEAETWRCKCVDAGLGDPLAGVCPAVKQEAAPDHGQLNREDKIAPPSTAPIADVVSRTRAALEAMAARAPARGRS